MKYNYLLWDIDDTLIDFKESEKKALKMCFKQFGIELTNEAIEIYSKINHDYWDLLAQGKIEKTIMLQRRFEDFVEKMNYHKIDCYELNQMYQNKLGDYAVLMEGAYDVCTQLKQHCKQYALTNGTIVAQNKKLNNTGLIRLLDGVYISDQVGYQKPDQRYFELVFNSIENFDPTKAIMIGDSLINDMAGANYAGIDCCWFNPKELKNTDSSIQITYEIKKLSELFELIQ